jgi:hypothetical protein
MVYLITWDLNQERANYALSRAELIKRLNQYNQIKDPGLDSVVFINTSLSADQIYNHLKQGVLDANDSIIITKLNSGEHQGWLRKDVWNWINGKI